MGRIYRMPDIPWDYAEDISQNQEFIILHLSVDYLMKRIFTDDQDGQVLADITDLKLPGYTTPKRIFISDDNRYYYLYSQYLNNYENLDKAVANMTPYQIVLTFKQILLDLKSAHQVGFNPNDICFQNYMVSPNNKPTFVDFNFSILNGRFAYKFDNKLMCDITPYGRINEEITPSNLNLSDKIQILRLLLRALTNKLSLETRDELSVQKKQFEVLKSMYKITNDLELYLKEILITCHPPKDDDYFIDDAIEPLLELTRNP